MTKVAHMARKTESTCWTTVKWFGDNGKPFGFLSCQDGEDIYIHRDQVEEAQEIEVVKDTVREGDALQVSFKEEDRGLAVVAILAHKPAPEMRGFVQRFTKEGSHAILKVDGLDDEVFVFNRIATAVGLTLGDEVTATVYEGDRGFKASEVHKTGNRVELSRPLSAKDEVSKKKARSQRHEKPKQPQALHRGVYGIVRSYKPGNGFGFITIDPEAETGSITGDLFVSYKAVERAINIPELPLRDGDVLQFDIFPDQRHEGRFEAQNLRFVERSKAAPKHASAPPRKAPVYESLTGVVDWKDPDATYGFIKLDEPLPGLKPEMFIHISDVLASGLSVADIIGAVVTFDVTTGRKPGELQATNLRDVIAPAAIADLFDEISVNADIAAE